MENICSGVYSEESRYWFQMWSGGLGAGGEHRDMSRRVWDGLGDRQMEVTHCPRDTEIHWLHLETGPDVYLSQLLLQWATRDHN